MKYKQTINHIEKVAVKMLSATNSLTLYKVCVSQAVKLAKANYGSIFLEKNNLLVRAYSTVPVSLRIKPRRNGTTYKSFIDGKTRFILRSKMTQTHPESKSHPNQVIVIPLMVLNKRFGVITLHASDIPRNTSEIKDTLKIFSYLAALAIRNIQLYEESQATVKSRDLFMSTASHELKTPIASISAYAQLIEHQLNKDKPIKDKWIKAILFNTNRLEVLISDLFNFSQMSLGIFEYKFTKVNLTRLLQSIITDASVISDRKFVFGKILSKEINIPGDESKLTLVFTNIVRNAIKYSEDTPITVSVLKRKSEILVKISDKGSGIAKEDLPYIFDQFYQGKNKKKGMGLGLYLCNEIVQAHHGRITVTSKLNSGTQVYIYLPITN